MCPVLLDFLELLVCSWFRFLPLRLPWLLGARQSLVQEVRGPLSHVPPDVVNGYATIRSLDECVQSR